MGEGNVNRDRGRRGRPVPESTGQRSGDLHGREELVRGAGAHVADAAGACKSRTGIRSSWPSCARSTGPSAASIASLTTTPPTVIRRSRHGWQIGHARHEQFIPTYSSWLNQVEGPFSLIAHKAIRRGSFTCVRKPVRRIDHIVTA